ncbi:hypothetical protein QM467_04540 [Rhodoblastus sp. 17X3]|uniref:hypothetical protein n=1 Tax=Rhodoblastus sp. 17X3 TaxID=3047026 RepID=UPI0024B79773|nr:hypothetical protein [Rhodoblastus sp. 17X3]MDI9847327.1 hypothetical protein [Rhodoblastus sp. 17X3]
MADKIRQMVVAALQCAEENGADFAGWTPEQIADDMLDYDADLAALTAADEGFDPSARAKIVEAIKAERPGR